VRLERQQFRLAQIANRFAVGRDHAHIVAVCGETRVARPGPSQSASAARPACASAARRPAHSALSA
jgi:hypothetical protein